MKIKQSLIMMAAASAFVAGTASAGLLGDTVTGIEDTLTGSTPDVGPGPGVPTVPTLPEISELPIDPTMTIIVPGNLGVPQTCSALGINVDLKAGAMFTQINRPEGSTMVVYNRTANGRLCEATRVPTGGLGDNTGIVTSAQNNVVTRGNECVYVANPGDQQVGDNSGTISVFSIQSGGVTQVGSPVPTNGPNPRAIAMNGDLLYVTNAGIGAGLFGPNVSVIRQSIQGYTMNADCSLNVLGGSFNVTNDHEGDPGDLNFTVDGKHLIVAQRRTTMAFGSGLEPSNAEVFPVNADGTTGSPVVNDIQEQGPFGFRTYQRNGEQRSVHTHGNFQLIGQGGTSSWKINADSTMSPLTNVPTGDDSPNVIENGGSDTCWNVLGPNNRWTYTSAFFDSALQRHSISNSGSLGASEPAGGPGGISSSNANGPNANMYSADQGGLDMAITAAGDYVYVMNAPVPPPNEVPATSILPLRNNGGALEGMDNFRITGLPSRTHGLAGY